MPTKTVTARYINQGTSKKGNPYWNIKTAEDETFWSKTGYPIPGVAKDASVELTYEVNKSGFNNIISIGQAANGKVASMRAEMAPKDALGAFRTTAFNAYVGAGMVPLDAAAIRDALRKIEAGYTQAIAPAMVQSGRDMAEADEVDDEIPY